MALSRLNSLEKKIYKNPELANRVQKQINEYLEKGYAHKTSYEELNSGDPKRVWYLPLGIVVSPKKPEKLRLIWDASSKVRNVSFNSMVLKGPDLLTSLPAILFRFRSRKVAICGDLKEMFHQIKIRKEDRSAQRFLWRENPSAKPEVYTMDVATFGSACSPCSAQYIKNRNANDYKEEFPEAAEAIINGHYVDDYLDSKDSEQEIISLINDIRFVHQQVLHWIHSDTRKYHSYVACRIGEILTSTNTKEWRWVPSRRNVADEATKWGCGPCFEADSRWLLGPDFLWGSEDSWPEQKWKPAKVTEELRSSYFHKMLIVEEIIDVNRFHKWERMLRTIAYAFRFGTPRGNSNTTIEPKSLELLDQKYLRKAETVLLQIIQRESFPEEIIVLQRKPAGVVPITSPLYKLSAYIDKEGLVRMDGRIGAAPNLPIEAKCPIILAKNHPITFLLIDSYHRRYLHRNAETVFNEIRQRFYIPGLRKLIRTVGSRCQWCKVYGSVPTQPKMAPLPKARLTAFLRPFTFTGLDYFGPILVKVGRSHVKRWVALFTCFTTRAIHMEVAHSLSTVSCKLCIRRFIARRGAPAEIYSDNGTNFRGAANELQKQLLEVNQGCAETFTNTNTNWFFNPPAAPHTGGVWERLVRSVKTALEALHDVPRVPDDETFETIILEAESLEPPSCASLGPIYKYSTKALLNECLSQVLSSLLMGFFLRIGGRVVGVTGMGSKNRHDVGNNSKATFSRHSSFQWLVMNGTSSCWKIDEKCYRTAMARIGRKCQNT
ncbi:uncharacterized protein LOC129752114 [Uranotaenia lowii]|uniref:uncharacterized protein LOC129752114 n=1 Tax=Uranotaenia lowii TaxID=190385 RepID=UPI00247A41C3|nr:uncharacterized protein LOC129752114 [Uranotaenia lowii]